MSFFVPSDTLKGLTPGALLSNDCAEAWREEPIFTTIATLTTTTALAEQPIFRARHKMRVIGAWFSPGTAVTGNAAFFSVVIAVRHAAAPATQKIIATYSADATPAKDVAAFASRDLWASGDVNASAADADFILAIGDVVTITITKPGSMTYPIASVGVICEMRD
jgi:hypothetical protein